jgi:hypothetical protein
LALNKKINTTLKQGDETFIFNEMPQGFKLIEFWRWSVSDIVSNATRGRLAEFIIAKSLGIDTNIVRDEWQAFDLITPDGIKIEVKSAAYIQSWYQKELSKIYFSIKKSRAWSSETNIQSKEAKRQADAYIFALLKHTDKETINPLLLDQWIFYILSTDEVNNYKRSEHSITLKSLEKLTNGIDYSQIKDELHKKIIIIMQ